MKNVRPSSHYIKYVYRCIYEATGAAVATKRLGLKQTKSAALALSRQKDTEIRIQKQERGHTDWSNTSNLFRRGQQVMTATA